MPDNAENSPNDLFSNVIKESTEFAKQIYVEQRLPALILILTIVSLVTVILSSPSETTRLFLWCITIPLLLILTFFVLPKQGKEVQKIKKENRKLADENIKLKSTTSAWSDKIKQVRDQISDLTISSLSYLGNIENSLNDIKSQVNEFLTSEGSKNSDEYLQELDEELSRLLEYVKLKKQEIDGLQTRIPAADIVLKSAPKAAEFLANLQDKMESREDMSS